MTVLWVGGAEQRNKPQFMICVSTDVLATFRHYCLGSFFWTLRILQIWFKGPVKGLSESGPMGD